MLSFQILHTTKSCHELDFSTLAPTRLRHRSQLRRIRYFMTITFVTITYNYNCSMLCWLWSFVPVNWSWLLSTNNRANSNYECLLVYSQIIPNVRLCCHYEQEASKYDHAGWSSNRNIFCLTGLWGEFIGHRWIPLSKTSDAEPWYFLWSVPK